MQPVTRTQDPGTPVPAHRTPVATSCDPGYYQPGYFHFSRFFSFRRSQQTRRSLLLPRSRFLAFEHKIANKFFFLFTYGSYGLSDFISPSLRSQTLSKNAGNAKMTSLHHSLQCSFLCIYAFFKTFILVNYNPRDTFSLNYHFPLF